MPRHLSGGGFGKDDNSFAASYKHRTYKFCAYKPSLPQGLEVNWDRIMKVKEEPRDGESKTSPANASRLVSSSNSSATTSTSSETSTSPAATPVPVKQEITVKSESFFRPSHSHSRRSCTPVGKRRRCGNRSFSSSSRHSRPSTPSYSSERKPRVEGSRYSTRKSHCRNRRTEFRHDSRDFRDEGRRSRRRSRDNGRRGRHDDEEPRRHRGDRSERRTRRHERRDSSHYRHSYPAYRERSPLKSRPEGRNHFGSIPYKRRHSSPCVEDQHRRRTDTERKRHRQERRNDDGPNKAQQRSSSPPRKKLRESENVVGPVLHEEVDRILTGLGGTEKSEKTFDQQQPLSQTVAHYEEVETTRLDDNSSTIDVIINGVVSNPTTATQDETILAVEAGGDTLELEVNVDEELLSGMCDDRSRGEQEADEKDELSLQPLTGMSFLPPRRSESTHSEKSPTGYLTGIFLQHGIPLEAMVYPDGFEKMALIICGRLFKIDHIDHNDHYPEEKLVECKKIAASMIRCWQKCNEDYESLLSRYDRAKATQNSAMLDLREELHTLLRNNAKRRKNYRFSEVVDLTMYYFNHVARRNK